MTILAIHTKETSMNFWFAVAVDTFLWCLPVPLDMAVQTSQSFMGAIKWEYAGMIKHYHPVNSIMAIQAIRSHLLLVHLHLDGIVLVMATDTALGIESIERIQVTRCTPHRSAIIILVVAIQAKTRAGEVLESFALPSHIFPPV